ncbi:C40 family peptidase [Thalassiella azotivora]
MSSRATARHRAASRPTTPLTVLVEVVSANATTMTRRSAVVAASSGLVVTMGLPAATATPLTDGGSTAGQDVDAPADQVAEVTAPEAGTETSTDAGTGAVATVSVPADAAVTFAGATLTSVTPPPPPPPPPAPVEEADEDEASGARQDRPARASRSERSAAADSGSQSATRPSASEAAGSVLAVAERYVGTMYRYGGTTPEGFDCSGFTQYVYAQLGVSLPRTSSAQAQAGRRVPASEARPGDLVWTPGHIGIYAGGNMMYDSPRTGKAVAKREIWYTPTFIRVG